MTARHDVAVLVGSLRRESLNRKLAKALIELAPATLDASIVEIAVRIAVAYAILRGFAEITKRQTAPFPINLQYHSQQPTIEFEDVKP